MTGRYHHGYLSLTAGMLIALMGIYTVPYVVGTAMTSMALPASAAGWLGSIEIGCVAIASGALSPLVTRLDARRVALAAALVAALASLLSAAAGDLSTFVLLRGLAGLAGGVVLGIVTAKIAATGHAERTYGLVYTGMSIVFAALLYGLPAVQSHLGPGSLFPAIALFTILLTAGLYFLPGGRPTGEAVPGMPAAMPWRAIGLLFLSMTLAFTTYGGVYAFSERIGADLHMTASEMGGTLAASTITAIFGSSLAALAGDRLGRTLPLCGAMLVVGIAYLLILGAGSKTALFAGMVLYGLVTMFFNAFAYGTAAALDPRGRIASALQGYSLIPYALGPGILGMLAEHWTYARLAWPTLMINVMAIVLVAPVVLRLDRRGSREDRKRSDVESAAPERT